MFSIRKKNLGNMRPALAFLLMVAFLLLSYCPLRKTIQNFIKGTHETEQTSAGHGKQLTSRVCQGVINSSLTKLILPEPEFSGSIPVLSIIILSLFYSHWRFFTFEKNVVFHPKFSIGYRYSIPIYLRNRILLI